MSETTESGTDPATPDPAASPDTSGVAREPGLSPRLLDAEGRRVFLESVASWIDELGEAEPRQ